MYRSLETFCAVVAAGSLNVAAERLHLSQPAVSKQIRALEGELGVQLFLRGSRGVELTPVGQQVYRFARRAVAAMAGCRRAAQSWQDPASGRLVVAAGLTLTLFTLPPVIQAFRSAAPGVRLEVVSANSREATARLLGFDCDVALVTSPESHPELQSFPLFVDPLVVAGGLGLELPRQIREIGRATLISFSHGSGLRRYIDQVLEGRGVRPEVVMEFDSIEAIKTMAALGLGLALLPWSAVREDVAQGRLQADRLEDWPDAGRTVTLLRRRAGLRPGPVGLFTATARRVLAGLKQGGPTRP